MLCTAPELTIGFYRLARAVQLSSHVGGHVHQQADPSYLDGHLILSDTPHCSAQSGDHLSFRYALWLYTARLQTTLR